MLNFFAACGYLSAEPVQHYDAKGLPYITFRLGVRRNFSSKARPYDFIQFRAAGKVMDTFLRYVEVGQCVTVQGTLRSSLLSTPKGDIPTEYKSVERVYFDRQRDTPLVPSPSVEEPKAAPIYDGFDENGLFPSESGTRP